MKKIVSASLVALVLNIGLGVNAFAQTNALQDGNSILRPVQYQSGPVSIETVNSAAPQLKIEVERKTGDANSGFDIKKAERDTMASYQKTQAAGKKFSRQTKILIGVGIAAAAIGIFIFAASRDEIRPFQ